MLSAWTEILPLFVHRLLARGCQRQRIGGRVVAVVRPGVMVETPEKPVVTMAALEGLSLPMGAWH